MYVLNEANGRV